MPCVRLPCSLHTHAHTPLNGHALGYALYPAYVDQCLGTYAGYRGTLRLPEPTFRRGRAHIRYGLQLPTLYDLPYLQHAAEDGPVAYRGSRGPRGDTSPGYSVYPVLDKLTEIGAVQTSVSWHHIAVAEIHV